MAGTLKPTGVKSEARYKIHTYNLYDPAENLFNGSYTVGVNPPHVGTSTRPTGTSFAYWNNASHFLDIEFFNDVNIWDAGTGTGTNSTHISPLKVHKNENGIKGDFLKNLSSNILAPTTPNWSMVGSLPKGRYRIEFDTGLRISSEWYLENLTTDKSFILHGDGYKKYDEGSPAVEEKWTDDTKSFVPNMSTYKQEGFTVFFSSEYSPRERPAYGAFNDSVDYAGLDMFGFVGIILDAPKKLLKYKIKPYNPPAMTPKDFRIFGSKNTTDGVNGDWILIDTRNGVTSYTDYFTLTNVSEPYIAYKLKSDAIGNPAYGNFGIGKLELFQPKEKISSQQPATPPSWKTVSSTLPTLPQFQSEGMEDLTVLDRKVQAVVGSPQTMTESVLGAGKVYKGTVDLKKIFNLRKLEVK